MRHLGPLFAAAAPVLIISTAMGIAIANVTGATWMGFVLLGLGVLLIALGLRWHLRLAPQQQARVYRWLCVQWFVELGFWLGGMPGALCGGWLIGEPGELVGWILTGSVASVFSGFLGWEWSARHASIE